MRFQNWDVLLFPEESKAPLQEFRTGCFVISDPDSTELGTVTPVATSLCDTIPPQIPAVACFVPSIEPGSPFRVSLHSWQPPALSSSVEPWAPLESILCFEARVLLDGICVANILFGQQPTWPQLLDTTSHLNESGNAEPLRFPPFHQELLTQNWWNAGENLGRIRVIISEGLVHAKVTTPPFERLKNIVSFSFQHAPMVVLENAGIAWPNPGMWYNAPPGWYSVMSPSSKSKAGDSDTHEHSSKCQMVTDDSPPMYGAAVMPPRGPSQLSSAPQTLYNLGEQLGDPSWSPSPSMPDPFVDENKSQKQGKGTGCGSSKPNRSHSATLSNSYFNATNDVPQITIENELATAIAESQFDEMMASFIRGEHKTFTPIATRMNTPVHTSSLCDELSSSPNSRPFNEQHRAVPVTTRDPPPPPPGSREPSDINIALSQSETPEPVEQAVVTVKQTPALIIRSKKEGLGLTRKSKALALANGGQNEDRRWSQEAPIMVGEAKRKWSGNSSTSSLLRDISNVAPVHKASRIGSKGDQISPHTREMPRKGADWAPQGELEQIH